MKNFIFAFSGLVMAALASGCNPAKRCTSSTDCADEGVCFQGYCFEGDAGVSGKPDGGDAGSTGATDGGDGGGMVVVPEPCKGVSCAEGYECQANASDAGVCHFAYEGVTLVKPAGTEPLGPFGPGQSVEVEASLQLKVGFQGINAPAKLQLTSTALTSGVELAKSGSSYAGAMVLPSNAANGTQSMTVRFDAADAGVSVTKSFEVDATGPTFVVSVVGSPNYGTNGGELVPVDPNQTGAWRKDEVLTIEVSSTASDVNASSVTVVAQHGGHAGRAAEALSGSCASGPAPFCQRYALDLSRVEMPAFRGNVTVKVNGSDTRGNIAAEASTSVGVTRWQWARKVAAFSPGIRGSVAIASNGDVMVPIAGGSGGVWAVRANGNDRWTSVGDGVVEGSPAIGRDAVGVEYVVYQLVASGELVARRADSRDPVSNACLGGSSGDITKASPAVMNDGANDMMGLSVQAATSNSRGVANQVKAAECYSTGSLVTIPPIEFPGNVVASGLNAYWVGGDAYLRGALWVPPVVASGAIALTPLAASIGGVGTVNGLALLPGGIRIAGGGGGGAGIGKLFVHQASDGAEVWHYPSGSDAPVSGPIVVDSNGASANGEQLIVAKRMSSGRVQVARLTLEGGVVAESAELNADGHVSAFGSTQVPTPVAGAGGHLYVIDRNGRLFVMSQQFEANAQATWAAALPTGQQGAVTSSPTISCNFNKPSSQTGVLYIATESGWLVSYLVDSRGLDTTAPWPKYQHDVRNTGNLGTALEACP